MNRFFALVLLGVCVSACAAANTSSGGLPCKDGVCLSLQVIGTIQRSQPVTVIVTLTSPRDSTHVPVALRSDTPLLRIESGTDWAPMPQETYVDLQANQTVSITRRVLIPSAGYWTLVARARVAPDTQVQDQLYMVVAEDTGMGQVYRGGTRLPSAEAVFGTSTPVPGIGPMIPRTPIFRETLPAPLGGPRSGQDGSSSLPTAPPPTPPRFTPTPPH